MSRYALFPAAMLVVFFLLQSANTATPQAPAQPKSLQQRVDELERRITSLERQLGLQTLRRPTVIEAERTLASALKRLQFTQKLVKEGYVTSIEQKRDQFSVDRAKKLVELSKAAMAQDADRIRLQINKMEADYGLTAAQDRLRYNVRLSARGFVPEIAVTEARLEVERAVERARQAKDELVRFQKMK